MQGDASADLAQLPPSHPLHPASPVDDLPKLKEVHCGFWVVDGFIRNPWWQLIPRLMRLFIAAHLLPCGLLR